MSKIINGGLTRSGTGWFAYPHGDNGRQRVNFWRWIGLS